MATLEVLKITGNFREFQQLQGNTQIVLPLILKLLRSLLCQSIHNVAALHVTMMKCYMHS